MPSNRDARISGKVSVIQTDSGIVSVSGQQLFYYLYLYPATKVLTGTNMKKLKTFDVKFRICDTNFGVP